MPFAEFICATGLCAATQVGPHALKGEAWPSVNELPRAGSSHHVKPRPPVKIRSSSSCPFEESCDQEEAAINFD
ncbi:hypothetical protein EJB05_05067 [Eragrostis curvula]|uniref:Uncharacterized protein n=1 Tax=Eragrostis curvula TaxID=38414 RepID=A0A5J9WCE5_9POAL|nr:hypothetical protein EJB05_05067 [Eragrostis curvula]